MEVLHERCGGLDVHKETIFVCLLIGLGKRQQKVKFQIGTFHHQLLELRRVLLEHDVTHVLMESTGVYWMPVYEVLEGFVEVVIGNAQHIMNVPGRKTDETDAEWLAQLLRHGLVKPSFVPSRPFRELRQLTRYRRSLVQARASEENRIEKSLQIAGIKLSTVTTAVFGVSGMDMLAHLAKGEADPVVFAGLSRGRLRAKAGQIADAFAAPASPHTRELIAMQLASLDRLTSSIHAVEEKIATRCEPYRAVIDLLNTVPGVKDTVAIEVMAEIGDDMNRWKSHRQLAAMAGVCPGNYVSAGKRLKNRSRKGNPYLKSILVQAASSAINQSGSYYQAKFKRLKQSRGHKRALLAIAHALLVAIFYMLKRNEPHRDLGADHLRTTDTQARTATLVRQLRNLGYEATLTPSL